MQLFREFGHFAPQQQFFVPKNCAILVCFHPLYVSPKCLQCWQWGGLDVGDLGTLFGVWGCDLYRANPQMVCRVVVGGGVPLVGPQEELRGPSGYTSRRFTSKPRRELKWGFSGFIKTNKQTKQTKQTKSIPELWRYLRLSSILKFTLYQCCLVCLSRKYVV